MRIQKPYTCFHFILALRILRNHVSLIPPALTYEYTPPILNDDLKETALRPYPRTPPSSLCFSSPVFKRRERNSSFVIRSPLAQIACHVRSSVFHSSSVTRIARSLFLGSPDLGLAIITLLFSWLIPNSSTPDNKILVKKVGMSSSPPNVVSSRGTQIYPDLLPCRVTILAEGERKDVTTTKRRICMSSRFNRNDVNVASPHEIAAPDRGASALLQGPRKEV
ncbi:hypothetical protein ES703_23589 [subsurface metagenome]